MKEPTETTLDGHRYRVGNLNARAQFHVARRVGTVATAFVKALATVDVNAARANPHQFAQSIELFQPALDALAHLSDEDCDYVLNSCLSVVNREQPEFATWARIVSPNGTPMFDDIDMSTMLALVWEVLKGFLLPFIAAQFFGSPAAQSSEPKVQPKPQTARGPRSKMAKAG